MNKFQYELKLKELERCKTKKAKADFIREQRVTWRQQEYTMYDLMLLIHTQNTITDESITGVKSLTPNLNSMIPRISNLTIDQIDSILNDIQRPQITGSNDYNAFVWSSGVPAFLKLIVQRALLEEKAKSNTH